MPATDFDALEAELDELRTHRDRLAAALAPSLDSLRASGIGFDRDLLHSLRAYHQRHQDLQRQLHADPELPISAAAISLDDWGHAVRAGRRQRQLAAMFDRLQRLHIRGTDSPGPLAAVLDEARQLQRQTSAGDDPLTDDLLTGRHPLASLLSLVCRGEELADDEWSELQDRVAARYGRDVSTAIARGRVSVLRDEATANSVNHEVRT